MSNHKGYELYNPPTRHSCRSCGKEVTTEDNFFEVDVRSDRRAMFTVECNHKSGGLNCYSIYYHLSCYRSRMDITTYVDDKMDKATYPINYNSPKEKQSEYDLLADIYRVLGSAKATEWVKQNKFNNIDLEDVFHKIVDNEIDYH